MQHSIASWHSRCNCTAFSRHCGCICWVQALPARAAFTSQLREGRLPVRRAEHTSTTWRLPPHSRPRLARLAVQQASSSAAGSIDETLLRQVWDSIGRPLLRVGSIGLQESHENSLRELLAAHTAVKVQLNNEAATPESVDFIAEQLGQAAGGQLLQAKGQTLLFTARGASTAALQQLVADARARRNLRQARRAAKADQPQLSIAVRRRLQALEDARVVQAADFDRHAQRVLAELPEGLALTVLEGCTKRAMREVRNKSAWLTAQCRLRLAAVAAAAPTEGREGVHLLSSDDP